MNSQLTIKHEHNTHHQNTLHNNKIALNESEMTSGGELVSYIHQAMVENNTGRKITNKVE